ncbi:helix-turn-helix domain-containing protein [Nocardioides sp. Y6]|uniref:Helix-turn-helix domain-containing protein n=1 Tax=Nocardioides malaquae TaxID=2773426 RepID=A0ABR9RSW1_9ACTN|nr:helix-turn-helix domain-containing protein [Nocardioides malaquae]MBE7324257.1 helix-turn-helix domain-containing protein [Nocardioides malaquae]
MDTSSSPLMGLEPLLSTTEVADYLGVPVKTIYEWRTHGHGPCAVRVGRHLKFAVSDVQAWVAQHREPQPGHTTQLG